MKNLKNIFFLLIFGPMCTVLPAQSLKIMTYNIRLDVSSDGENDWTHRKDFFTSQIQFHEPDVFGVQEATPNQVVDISNVLLKYNNVGMGREGVGKGESSNIYFKKDKFTILDSSTFWLSDTPNEISMGWDAACNRVCTYALFKDNKTKQFFWVFNTHLDHIGEMARTKGIELILSKIASLNAKKYPVIFMGDFNTEPNEDRIIKLQKVMDDTKDLSQNKPFGPEGTFNGFKHNEPVTKRIDYIFISKNNNLNVMKYAVLSDSKDLKYPSDHLPVLVELNFKK
ncbi:endonuclease/exonuclease/phosphatase family protein [Flavobacterium sp. WC2429]|uniref:Endonuclease/exonuclease/phosphatase family protein n=2 Tax=unclassified Flavobacterium TaxID=196869 RepID=A0AB39WB07_9FLAO